ncbi:MAG: HipA N-terminal domain-containing protein, partial [Zoogloeaceae bacterium]|nr:HipA N-terminal domain-containing protein [Zoogloeaceae bacterium]
MKLIVTMDWLECSGIVGELEVFERPEGWRFTYSQDWAERGFQLGQSLPLFPGFPHQTTELPSAFQDVAPDKWGRFVLEHSQTRFLSEADYLLGVSDNLRMGALRLSSTDAPEIYLSERSLIPKLVALDELEEASLRMENGRETDADLRALIGVGTSVGGAYPKIVVE